MIPVDIKKIDPRTLQIEWDDGHLSRYPFEFLRRQCPCASCSEARRAPAKPANPLRVLQAHEIIGGNLDIKQAEVVGRYALSFQWSDGHGEGIYTFDFLRDICQCENCVQKGLG
ncbi:MAG: gamma-butyrobetaine hydroxylase-like domain-containing protein [bacterium]